MSWVKAHDLPKGWVKIVSQRMESYLNLSMGDKGRLTQIKFPGMRKFTRTWEKSTVFYLENLTYLPIEFIKGEDE